MTDTAATYRYAEVDCPNQPHESGMVYDMERDCALCPLCGRVESIEMGSL